MLLSWIFEREHETVVLYGSNGQIDVRDERSQSPTAMTEKSWCYVQQYKDTDDKGDNTITNRKFAKPTR